MALSPLEEMSPSDGAIHSNVQPIGLRGTVEWMGGEPARLVFGDIECKCR